MNEFRKYRVALATLAGGVLTTAMIYFVYLPARAKAEATNSQISGLAQQVAGLTEFLRSVESATEFTQDLASERDLTLGGLYNADSLEGFIDTVIAMIESHGLTDVKVAPVIGEILSPTTVILDGVLLSRLRFEIIALGNFIDGGKAIEELERQQYFISIPLLSIEHEDDAVSKVAWSFQLLAHFRSGAHLHG